MKGEQEGGDERGEKGGGGVFVLCRYLDRGLGIHCTRNGLGMRLSFSVFELNTIMGLIVRLHMGLTSMMQAREGTRMVQR